MKPIDEYYMYLPNFIWVGNTYMQQELNLDVKKDPF